MHAGETGERISVCVKNRAGIHVDVAKRLNREPDWDDSIFESTN